MAQFLISAVEILKKFWKRNTPADFFSTSNCVVTIYLKEFFLELAKQFLMFILLVFEWNPSAKQSVLIAVKNGSQLFLF
jgi:hypothetical protein